MNKYYFFDQNNSGGDTYKVGELEHLVIKASCSYEANRIAESMGLYFNGVLKDRDCPCCGDRWNPVSESDAMTLEEAQAKVEDYTARGWQKVGFANL